MFFYLHKWRHFYNMNKFCMIKTGPDLYNKSYNKLTAAVFCLDTDCNVRFLKPLIVSNVEICKRL